MLISRSKLFRWMLVGALSLGFLTPVLSEEKEKENKEDSLDQLQNLRLELSRMEMENKVLEMRKDILELEQEASITQADLENELSRIHKRKLYQEEQARIKAETTLSSYQQNLILPGWGHYSSGQKNRSYIYGGLFLTSLSFTAYSISRTEQLGNRVSEFDILDPLSIRSRDRFEASREESAAWIGITLIIYGLALADPLDWFRGSQNVRRPLPWDPEVSGPDAQNREPLNMQLVTTPILPAYSVSEKYQSLFRVTLSF
ncbi:MAG: hypothetical protein CMF59_02600 [Leptospiraceae bacterium]|nr:hypothetical protein [Leptospiraceae bacterium]